MTPDPTPAQKPAAKTAGRKPGQAVRPADAIAIENLEGAVSRLLWYLTENPASALGIRLARCAKGGVERGRAERGLQMIEAAVATARVQLEAAYAAPKAAEKGETIQRPHVSL